MSFALPRLLWGLVLASVLIVTGCTSSHYTASPVKPTPAPQAPSSAMLATPAPIKPAPLLAGRAQQKAIAFPRADDSAPGTASDDAVSCAVYYGKDTDCRRVKYKTTGKIHTLGPRTLLIVYFVAA